MGHKLLILAAIGLGALYLLHLLAQDYMKIRKPAAKLARFLLSKRDLNAVESKFIDHEDKFEIDWQRILKNDVPLMCLQSLICQIVAGTEKENEDAIIMNYLIEYAMKVGAPKEIERAYKNGQNSVKSSEKCYLHYKLCPWSGKTMLRILRLYSYIFSNDS